MNDDHKLEFLLVSVVMAILGIVVCSSAIGFINVKEFRTPNAYTLAAKDEATFWVAKESFGQDKYFVLKKQILEGVIIAVEPNTLVKDEGTFYAPRSAHTTETCKKVLLESGAFKGQKFFLDSSKLVEVRK